MEPKKIEEALVDPDWVIAMQDELNQFEQQQVWKLVPRPKNKSVIGTRWVFRNKLDEDGIVIRTKQGWWQKVILKLKALIMMKPMHQWQGLRLSGYSWHLQHTLILKYIKWMSRVLS